MFKEYLKNEAFGLTAGAVDKKFRVVCDYFFDQFNVQKLKQVKNVVSIDIESNLSSSELEEIEDQFDDFVFSIDRRTHVIRIEEV